MDRYIDNNPEQLKGKEGQDKNSLFVYESLYLPYIYQTKCRTLHISRSRVQVPTFSPCMYFLTKY